MIHFLYIYINYPICDKKNLTEISLNGYIWANINLNESLCAVEMNKMTFQY